MCSKCMTDATFVRVSLNLLRSKLKIFHCFFFQGNARKCHICLKFAVVGKSRDNMVFFLIFGGVVTKILQVLSLKL